MPLRTGKMPEGKNQGCATFRRRRLVSLITGAERSIGLAYAEADNGARVAFLDKDSKSLDAEVKRLAGRVMSAAGLSTLPTATH